MKKKKIKKVKTPVSADQPTVGRKPRGEITTWAHRRAMLDWLNKESNFKLVTGSATSEMKHPVAGAIVSKKAGFELMAKMLIKNAVLIGLVKMHSIDTEII